MFGLNRNLVALSAALFLVLGAIAVSIASPPPAASWLFQPLGVHRVLKDKVSLADTETLRAEIIIIEEGGLQILRRGLSARHQVSKERLRNTRTFTHARVSLAPTVLIPILHSALNL